MGDAARRLAPTTTAEQRRAAILALPLRAEPETDEERAIFDEAAEDMHAGRRGHTTAEIEQSIEQMRLASE